MANYLFFSKNLFIHQIKLQLKRYSVLTPDHIAKGSIRLKSNNPFELFKEWMAEAKKYIEPPLSLAFVLSCYTEKEKVTSRVMRLTEQKNDKFVFVGTDRSRKFHDPPEHVSLCFWWHYPKDKHYVMRQVRVKGTVTEISQQKAAEMFEKYPPTVKIQYYVCRQNEPAKDWVIQQEAFFKKKDELKHSGVIKVPKHITGLEATVSEILFFHNVLKLDVHLMPDRVLFTKDGNNWKPVHLDP